MNTKLYILLVILNCCLGWTFAEVSIDGSSDVSAHVIENSDEGTEVIDFHAVDSDEGTITWTLSSYDNFTISSEGVVTVDGLIDREATLPPHVISLTVTATSGSNSDTVSLTVTIQDVNDNAPFFENTGTNSDTVVLPEDEPEDTIIYSILASDPDHGSGGNYHFVLTNPDGYFEVGYLTGDIELIKSLDHESNTQHKLIINIEDEGTPQFTAVVTITVNVTNEIEQAPVFTQKLYYTTLAEGTYSVMSPPTLTTVTAIDADSDSNAVIKYQLIDNGQNWFDQFSIGETTGAVYVTGSLDRETKSRYIISVQAREYLPGGNILADSPPSTATVVLTLTDINDNSPAFYSGSYSANVDEHVQNGHIVIASVSAFDNDVGSNAEFSYKIRDRSINTDDKFQINPITGVINVTGDLDYESGTIEYSFTIEAVEPSTLDDPNTGTAKVTIHIDDTNDHTPYFTAANYSYTIYENQPDTSFTPKIMAEDDDATSSFNILSFNINGIGTQAPNTHFTITEGTNEIQLSTITQLDRESIDFYHMIVTAKDNGASPLSSTANIFVTVLDTNDNPPVFDLDEYTIDIVEETIYSSCITVHAEDTIDSNGPNTQIIYTLAVVSASPNTTLSALQNTFLIDSGNGEITCLKVNYEYNYEEITLRVTATDSGTNPGPLSSTTDIIITVEDINEHPPVFTQASYNASIYEDHTVGQEIGVTVRATESGDDGLDHDLTYTITAGNVNGAFALDEVTGVMTLAHSLDWETLTPNPIVVTVRASDIPDNNGAVHSGFTTVMVYVTDVNDHSPVITAPLGNPSISVSEGETNLPFTITTIQATDIDGPSDGDVTYSFTHSSGYGSFEIDADSGVLTMTSPPDREAVPQDTFDIVLMAKDQPADANNVLSSTTTISIIVTDVNDHPPVFINTTYAVSIPEDITGAVSLLTIYAVDNVDLDENAEVEYSIMSITPSVFSVDGKVKFQIDSQSGVLQSGSFGFDYEDNMDRLYTVIMLAKDKGTDPMQQTATATATITITDVNDNAPQLVGNFFDVTINESSGNTLSPSNQVIITGLDATDVDLNTQFTYSIVDTAKTNGWFQVDEDNGNIYIPAGTNIDREHTDNVIDSLGRAVVTFEVQVSDGLFVDEAEISVYINDINDQSPVFSESSISTTLPEGVPYGTVVEIVTATDSDHNGDEDIRYTKTSGDPDNLFSIPDSTVGKITVAGEIDKEMINDEIVFEVTAADSAGNTDTIIVTVEITDTNDNSPIFNPTFYQVTIPENTPEDAIVELVNATDRDDGVNGAVTFEIIGGNVNNAFKIKTPSKGDIRVDNNTAIDRETLSFYRLIVIAKDGASGAFQRTSVAEVVVHISDINDNTPEFLYSVHRGTVAEHSNNNTFVSVTPSIYATDKDIGVNAEIIYDIQSGFPFTINKDTGFVYTSSIDIDREEQDSYNITVHARDKGGFETSAILLITVTDINDHPPIIDQIPTDLDTDIPEDYASGGTIANVTASDEDIGVNGQLRYSLTGGEGYFQVDPNTGMVALAQTILHLERRDPFVVTVTVTDGGLSAKQDSIIFDVGVTDINDNKPIFNHAALSFTQPEDVNVDQPLQLPIDPSLFSPGVVTDADDGLNMEYEFVLTSDSSSVFTLNMSGSLFLVNALDYESETLYTGGIVARDKGTPAKTSQYTLPIELIVVDVNDEPPVFDQSFFAGNVSEFTNANVPLLLLSATDADTLVINTRIEYYAIGSSPASGLDLFKVDKNSGLILTKTFLEESSRGCYELMLEARNPDSLLKDNASAIICITDQNESPAFDQSFYDFNIDENEPAGTFIGKVSATDPDNNVVLTYTLVTNPDDEGLFRLDSTTGELKTLAPLDREDQDLHILTVIVQDMGSDNFQHTNYTTILVTVNDINDNIPQLVFSSFSTEYIIPENITRLTTITTIEATDNDLSPLIEFEIVGDTRALFKIDHLTGLLQTEAGPEDFDRESFTAYTIIVVVYNPDDVSKSSNVSITFILTDVNDNAPVFITIPNDTCIYENSSNGFMIGTFEAEDVDIGINGKVFYQIIEGNDQQAFTIEALTGELKIQNALNYEQDPQSYTLTIEVLDLGEPQQSSSAMISICLLDTNDNRPTFTDVPSEPIQIEEHSEYGSVVHFFTIIDEDSHPFNSSTVNIVNGDENGLFYFNDLTKALHVNNSVLLDFENNGPIITLTLLATDTYDKSLNDTVSVTIVIIDVNDNAPQFDKNVSNITILESETANTILTQLLGIDGDSDSMLTYYITSGNEDGKFYLNEDTGFFVLKEVLDYDYGPRSYTLTVNVTDGVFGDEASIYVTVENVNDVPPLVTNPADSPFIIDIAENKEPGFLLYKIEAYDIEGGVLSFVFSNDLLEYGDPPTVRINVTSGEITIVNILDKETQDSLEFTVIVKSDGDPELQTSIHFKIMIIDVNDNNPFFTSHPLELELYEDHISGVNSYIFDVTGDDMDVSDANNIYYYVVMDDRTLATAECGVVFCIGRTSGLVYHNRNLDRETQDSYVLTLTISNNNSIISEKTVEELGLSTILLPITILDVNDNPPVFTYFTNKIGVSENTAYGAEVFVVTTQDKDEFGNYDKVWYRLNAAGGPFVIDKETGIITTTAVFENLAGTKYTLLVEAFDNEGVNPSLFSVVPIEVYVYAYADNSVILTVNGSIDIIQRNIAYYTELLSNLTGQNVIITDIRVSTNEQGSIDTSRVDIEFIVINDVTDIVEKNTDVLQEITNGNPDVIPNEITIEIPTVTDTSETYPLWVIITIIVIMASVIFLLICAFCAFLIVEKRRNRKLHEEKSHLSTLDSDFSAITQEYNSTSNPIWIPPVLHEESISEKDVSIVRPNPVYEEQEVTLEVFDDDDDEDPPLGSTENLLPPPTTSVSSLRGSMTADDLLNQAVGLPLRSPSITSDDSEEDQYSFI